jgi:hypothetical protein
MKHFAATLTCLCLALVVSATVVAYDDVEGTGFVVNPILTQHGIVFTDNYSSTLYLSTGDSIRILISSPGCGNYYSISPDRNSIGFKLIDENGKQSPAIIDLDSKAVIQLHDGVERAGQVSFTNDGRYVFTIGTTLFVVRGKESATYDLGVYSNLAPISPNGDLVAYNDNNDQLWVMNLSTEEKSIITDSKRGYFNPQWASNSALLLYSSLNGIISVRDIASRNTYYIGEGINPSWSNDAQHVLFYKKEVEKDRVINSDLYLAKFDGSETIRLTNTPDVMEMDPKFVDNDTKVIFHTYTKKEICIAQISDNATVEKRAIQLHQPAPLQPREREVSLEIKKGAQLDLPYVNQVYDTPDWYNGRSACGPTSSIMVIAYYNLLPKWDVWCSASGPSPGHWSSYGNYVCERYRFRTIDYSYIAQDPNGKNSYGGYGYMWTGSYSPHSRMVGYYGFHGLSATLTDSPTFLSVVSEINAGYPYTLCNALTTAGHIIVVIGVDSLQRIVTVNDPYGNKNSGSYPSPNGKNVKYDWPGYTNGNMNLNTAWWGVSVRYTPPAIPDTVVDDLQFNSAFYMNNKAPATMYTWRDMNKGYNGHMWYAFTTWSDSVDTCYAIWRPTLSQSGMYEVLAFIPTATATNAKYKVYSKSGMQTIVVNQKNYVDSSASLGTYEFDKGSAGYVRLGDATGIKNEAVIFDAITWKYKGPSSPTLVAFGSSVPKQFSLSQNYPNPFNPTTHFRFTIPEVQFVRLRIFDVVGREAATLVNEEIKPGSYVVRWDASGCPSGVYFYRLTASSGLTGNFSETKRLILLK